jgi:hypothetical protein
MAPRSGGEADKIGNRYEGAWTIRHALYCVHDPEPSLTVEAIERDVAEGAEFAFMSHGVTQVYQVKRQPANRNSWSIKALAGLGVFSSAATHVAAGRQYRFASMISCGPLRELAERARKSTDLSVFTQSWLTEELRPAFDQLSAAEILGSAEAAWTTLRGMWLEVHDETDVIHVNAMLAELSLEGAAGHVMALAIGDILLDQLGQPLSQQQLLEALKALEIQPRAAGSQASIRASVVAATDSWRGSVQRELLRPAIERREVEQVVSTLDSNRLGLVVGTAGGGKSATLDQTVTALEASGAKVLALRLDRLEPFTSTSELGRQLGLDTSPVAALGITAAGGDGYLVVDQLDAVSMASGRMPESFDVVVDLIGEALSVSGLRVILACREFDVENDYRIRELASRPDVGRVVIGPLPDEDVRSAVESMGLDTATLTPSQAILLQTPLHLVLLHTIAGQGDALAFHSRGSLFEAFWERKRQTVRRRRDGTRFNEVIARVANVASDRQVLSIPIELLDEAELVEDANVLVSEHVLARQGARIAFFHEAFFDYAFARQWVSREESLVEFLLRDEQELFRRAQVRQILNHLRDREPERFVDEAGALLASPEVRFHIKEIGLAVLGNLDNPSAEEADLVLRLAATKPTFEERLWQQLHRPQWFRRFYDLGFVDTWLDSDDAELQARAVNLMVSGVPGHGDQVATLLQARGGVSQYLDWLRWIVRFGDVRINRRLFELLLAGVRQGGFDDVEDVLWLGVHNLAASEPNWAIELLQARLIDHVDALALGGDGKVAALDGSDFAASELVRDAAAAEPRAFTSTIVPYLLSVMAATEYRSSEVAPLADAHFGAQFPNQDLDDRNLDDALFKATVVALESLAQSEPEAIRSLLESLAADPHESAQFLLYRALTAGGPTFADWAASLLLEGGQRLESGYTSDSHWVARELLRVIAPHIGDREHQQLEDGVRDLRGPFEYGRSWGRTAFSFLSALDEGRLSATGARRLAEYRRKFGQDAPSPPQGIIGGFVGSPIGNAALAKMSDDQWLGAMAKYDKDGLDWEPDRPKGGARELAQLLKDRTKEDPDRFSRLALRITHDLHPAYGDAILWGLGETDVDGDREAAFAAIRHIASLGHADNDRWLGVALRRHYGDAPLDLVELILARTLHSSNPTDNSPVFIGRSEDGQRAKDLRENGFNTSRGSLAETLGDLLVYDAEGQRTEVVRPRLDALAGDPVLSVRSCVAHTIAAALRHARPGAYQAFEILIQADDILLATDTVQQLMLYIGNVNPEVIDPVIQRMLASEDDEVKEAGGEMAAFAALEWDRPDYLARALSDEAEVRRGAARICAARLDRTSNSGLATEALLQLMNDPDEDVRKAVAHVAPDLRGVALQPFSDLLEALIDSASYEHATPQLLITLEHAPDRVDGLVLKAAQRFIRVYGNEAGDIRTSAAGDVHYVSRLVVRGLAQSRDRTVRSALLDVLDLMLELGVYGVGDAIAASERR